MVEKKLVVMESLESEGAYLLNFKNNPNTFAFTTEGTEEVTEALNIPLEVFETFTRADQEQHEHLAKGLNCKLVVVTLQVEEVKDLDLNDTNFGEESSKRDTDLFKALFG